LNLSVVLDENIPSAIVDYLSRKRPDWTVRHVRDIGLRGASDKAVFDWAQKNQSIVITFDEDFADARMFPAGTHAGVIRLRLWPTTVEAAESGLDRLLNTTEDSILIGSLVVIGRASFSQTRLKKSRGGFSPKPKSSCRRFREQSKSVWLTCLSL
jgi:predicted nuclease of predicted toxin-antitoxin system